MMPNEIKKTGDTIEWHPRMMKIKCSLLTETGLATFFE